VCGCVLVLNNPIICSWLIGLLVIVCCFFYKDKARSWRALEKKHHHGPTILDSLQISPKIRLHLRDPSDE
jgi:hypothetical protein